ncbi:hypothetical protein [Alteromonas sp. 14N.309.X.WAT.G.H12]|uniref:hypothetical protein n=1 Tax=Alteromonas sp. 14N.309.X.WAT.G.H12 TaxID=3120824 RepID=UPI002FD65099
MKLVDNTSQNTGSVVTPEIDNTLHEKLAVNDVSGSSPHDTVQRSAPLPEHEQKPQLFVEHTPLETEQLWTKRLGMLLAAENKFAKVMRLRKSTSIVLVASVGISLFSLYRDPTMSPVIFWGLLAFAALALMVYPASVIATRSSRKHRNDISRMFYRSNHEIETSGGKLTLINRANYANVTHINIWDDKFG